MNMVTPSRWAKALRLAASVAGLIGRAFEVVVLVNVNFEDQGVRAAQRLERELQRLQAQAPA